MILVQNVGENGQQLHIDILKIILSVLFVDIYEVISNM